MENEETEIESFKNIPVLILFFSVFAFVSMFSIFKKVSASEFFKKPLSYINADNILAFIFIPIAIFIFFFCFNYEIKFDDKHLIYIHGLLKTKEEIYYKDILKIQHHSYQSGKSTSHEYRFFVQSKEEQEYEIFTLPYPVILNKNKYKKLFQKIFLANPDAKFTKLSKTFGKGTEKSMDLEEFF